MSGVLQRYMTHSHGMHTVYIQGAGPCYQLEIDTAVSKTKERRASSRKQP